MKAQSKIHVAFSVADCHAQCAAWRQAGETIAFVPTMGALHEGHLALIQTAKTLARHVVVSIFINPLQFTSANDFENYPRLMTSDLDHCEALGVDIVFTPSEKEMYPDAEDIETTRIVPPAELTDRLCGLARPGHFTGVATVVAKLFEIIQPHYAIFGEKDAQQLAVIQRLVRDLNMPVDIVPHATVRDDRGLALSSRNRRLESPAEIEASYALSRILKRAAEKILAGESDATTVFKNATEETLADLSGGARASFDLEYLEAADAETFAPVTELRSGVKLLIAANVRTQKTGDVRLIDNLNV